LPGRVPLTSELWLPAATTTGMLYGYASTALISFCSAVPFVGSEDIGVSKLRLITEWPGMRAVSSCEIHWRARMMRAAVQWPPQWRARASTTVAFFATPMLSPAAIDATAVPWAAFGLKSSADELFCQHSLVPS